MIVVACPTCEQKAYALDAWLHAYYNFNTSERTMFMVDNTPGTLRHLWKLRALGVPSEHVEPMADFWDGMELQWRVIVQHAHDIGAEWIASIEADMVCPGETLNVLAAASGGFKTVAHSYPARDDNHGLTVSLGCTLLKTSWLWSTRQSWSQPFENFAFSSGENNELHGVLDIEHLD